MRASRLLSILLLLQARGRMTAEALAAEFEVSVRTIYRDVDQLSAADVPIYADRGPSGGFQLLDGYRTRLTGLSPAEAETLSLAGLPGPAAQLGLADVLTAAQLKLNAALPERARANAGRVATRFHLDPVGWFRSADDAKLLPAIANAVWNEKCLDVRYRRAEGAVERRLQPLGLVLKAGIWYLVARREGEVRTYRASRIESLTLRDERFERPPGFDLASYWLESSAAWERDVPRLEVDVRVDPAFLDALDEQIGGEAYRAAEILEGNDPEGWVHLRLRLTYPHDAPGRLLGLGSHLEVLGPPETRQRVVALARGVLARHESR